MKQCYRVPDEVRAVEVLFWLPGVVLLAVAFPFDQVKNLAKTLQPFSDDFLDNVVVVIGLRKICNIKTQLSKSDAIAKLTDTIALYAT